MKQLKITLPLVAALSTLFVACQADIFVSVDEERQVTIVTSVGISEGLAEFAGVSLDDLLGDAIGGLGLEAGDDEGAGDSDESDGILGFLEGIGGNEVTRYSEDGYSGYRITQTLAAEELIEDASNIEGIAAFADLVPGFEFRRTDSDDGWIVSGNPTIGALIDDFSEGVGADGIGGLFSLASDSIDATLRIKLPGEIIESTAHRTVDGVEVWDLLDPEGVTIHVVSGESVPFQFVPWVIASLFAVIVIVIIAWQITSRRKRVASSIPQEPSQAEVTLNIDHQEGQAEPDSESNTSETTGRN